MRLSHPITLAELAAACGADVRGDATTPVGGLASLAAARGDELSFARSAKMRDAARASAAGALLVPRDFGALDRPGLVAGDVDLALARIGDAVLARVAPPPATGVHPRAVVAPGVGLGAGASVGPCAVVEEDAVIGARARVGAGVFVGRGAAIGDDTVLCPGATVYWGCRVGARCIVHAGAVIGADGFGFGKNADGSYRKINQIGTVVIEDDVEIGACTCIDRATFDATVIERGVKLDNLVHIAHNCRIGAHTAMAAQVGVAGSTHIGARGELGGQSGVAGHLEIGADVRVGAASPVIRSFGPGLELWGFPAREKSRALREMAGAARAGALRDELRALRARVETLERMLRENG